jgi:sulfoxide reductase heme-binding subunit YedZ
MTRDANGIWISIGLGLTALCAICVALSPDMVEGARLVIRVTARTSFALFFLVLIAAPLHRLWPGASSLALLRLRRQLGLSFAISHGLHLIAIITLNRLDPILFWQLTNIGNIVSGGLAYLFIAAMAATSFSPLRELIGPARWRMLHSVGLWYIALSFIVTNGKRVMVHPAYALPPLLIVAVLVVRAGLALKRRRLA